MDGVWSRGDYRDIDSGDRGAYCIRTDYSVADFD